MSSTSVRIARAAPLSRSATIWRISAGIRSQARLFARIAEAIPHVIAERAVFLHFVVLVEIDDEQRVFLSIDQLGLQRGVEFGTERAAGDAPIAANIDVYIAACGTRSLMPLRSSGRSIGRVLLVIWRKPLSHIASSASTAPVLAISSRIKAPSFPSIAAQT